MIAKALGNPTNRPGDCPCADPIDAGTGNVFEAVRDYTTAGTNPLSFTRYYNSMGVIANPSTSAVTLGANWRSTFDRYLQINSTTGSLTSVQAERPDGQVIAFTLSGSTWKSDSDVDYTLLNTSGSTWQLTDHNNNVETYTVSSGSNTGILQSIEARNGYTQNLNYTSGQLTSVTDSYSRTLGLSYNTNGLLSAVSTPDSGFSLSYTYTSAGGMNLLSSVGYSPAGTSQTYNYGLSNLPFALTSITDENLHQSAAWTYDSYGRTASKQRGGSLAADLTSFSYGSGTTTVTNAYGVADARLIITESAIDALSHAVLFPDDRARYASIGGKPSPQQLELIRMSVAAMARDSEIVSAMDNDAEGAKLSEVVRRAVVLTGRADLRFTVHEPFGFKDWNDQLRAKPLPFLPYRSEKASPG